MSRRPARTSPCRYRGDPITMPLCPKKENSRERTAYFLRNEQPSVSLALPPVGWQRTVVQPWQMTTVWAWEKTVVMVKQPGHLTSMKKERGAGTRVCTLSALSTDENPHGGREGRTLSLCLRASAAGLGLRRSTARTLREPSVSITPCSVVVHPALRCPYLPADCPISRRDLSCRQNSDVRLQI